MGNNKKAGERMIFNKPLKDHEDAKKLIAFMQEIYYKVDGDKSTPIEMKIILNNLNYEIVVSNDPVISTLDEDRGIYPTVPWHLYTFMNLMDSAGYVMDGSDNHSTVAIFYNKNSSSHCHACGTDCKYTGSVVGVPLKILGEYTMVPVRMCLGCASKFDAELNSLVDISGESASAVEDKPKKKPSIFKRFLGIFRK